MIVKGKHLNQLGHLLDHHLSHLDHHLDHDHILPDHEVQVEIILPITSTMMNIHSHCTTPILRFGKNIKLGEYFCEHNFLQLLGQICGWNKLSSHGAHWSSLTRGHNFSLPMYHRVQCGNDSIKACFAQQMNPEIKEQAQAQLYY